MKKDISFEITTRRRKSEWVFVAATFINELGYDLIDCHDFIINGKRFNFEYTSDLKINGLISKDWGKCTE